VVGGPVAGWALGRYDRRWLLAGESLVRAAVVGSVPPNALEPVSFGIAGLVSVRAAGVAVATPPLGAAPAALTPHGGAAATGIEREFRVPSREE